MVNGISPILQNAAKDVDCLTHQKFITQDWLEVVTDTFLVKAETNSMISTVSFIKNAKFQLTIEFQVPHISYASPVIKLSTSEVV